MPRPCRRSRSRSRRGQQRSSERHRRSCRHRSAPDRRWKPGRHRRPNRRRQHRPSSTPPWHRGFPSPPGRSALAWPCRPPKAPCLRRSSPAARSRYRQSTPRSPARPPARRPPPGPSDRPPSPSRPWQAAVRQQPGRTGPWWHRVRQATCSPPPTWRPGSASCPESSRPGKAPPPAPQAPRAPWGRLPPRANRRSKAGHRNRPWTGPRNRRRWSLRT